MSLGRDIIEDNMYELVEGSNPDNFRNIKQHTIFTRGYGECRKRLANNSRFTRSCFNCAYYYQAVGDKEEVCQNETVLQYDMVLEGNNIYCLKWQPSTFNSTSNIFKRGRSRLD